MLYPIALSLAGWPVLVVGGGAVGERRILGLIEAQAHVHVVAPEATPTIVALAREGRVRWSTRGFDNADLEGMRLVIAATNNPSVNAEIVTAARTSGILINDAVEAEQGDFRVPAVHRVGSLTFAVDTGGSSPSFARRIRDELAAHFPESYAKAAQSLRAIRMIISATVPLAERAEIMANFADLPISELAEMSLSDCENAVEEIVHEIAHRRDHLVSYAPQPKVCATRRSRLALTQTRSVMARLARAHVSSTILEVLSTGDQKADQPLTEIGTGIFISELETALRDGRADYAVHSCKDIPSTILPDMCLAAIPLRADPRDAFCSVHYREIDSLPLGARVGTSSPRRRAQVLLLRPDLILEEIRGNIDTRLRLLEEGKYDAIILAMAGMERLAIAAPHVVALDPRTFVPAVGQGALAIETRAADADFIAKIRLALNDLQSELSIIAERAFLAEVRGGCHAPVGAHAQIDAVDSTQPHLRIWAIIATPTGLAAVRGEENIMLEGPLVHADANTNMISAMSAGRRLAQRLLAEGGRALLASDLPLQGRVLALGRTQERPSRIAAALRAVGATVLELKSDSPAELPPRIDALLFPSSGSVAVLAQYLQPGHLALESAFFAAMGPESAATASNAGFPPHVVSQTPDVGEFVQLVTQNLLEQDR